jgi:hypothetical protein
MDWTGINELHGLAQRAAAVRQAEQLHKIDMEAVRILNDDSVADPNERYARAREHVVTSMLPKEVRGGIFKNLARTVQPPPNAMSAFQQGIFSQSRSGIISPDARQAQTSLTPDGGSFMDPAETAEIQERQGRASYWGQGGSRTSTPYVIVDSEGNQRPYRPGEPINEGEKVERVGVQRSEDISREAQGIANEIAIREGRYYGMEPEAKEKAMANDPILQDLYQDYGHLRKSRRTGWGVTQPASSQDDPTWAPREAKRLADQAVINKQFGSPGVKPQSPIAQDFGDGIEAANQNLNTHNPSQTGVLGGQSTGKIAPVQITTDDDYDQLPSGTQFIGPDGILRQKP